MNERGILFNAPMVRALLAGTKTQTRRAIRPQPDIAVGGTVGGAAIVGRFTPADERLGRLGAAMLCPFGVPGDRLWVRETWLGPLVDAERMEASNDLREFDRPEFCVYAADGGAAPEYMDDEDNLRQRWRPSIHMPRWASRITLEVTEVRVERLQAISEADAQAEGARRFGNLPYAGQPDNRWSMESPVSTEQCLSTARMAFANFINKMNGDGSWDANPWVWVVAFRRI